MRSDLIDRRISVAPMMDWTDRHCRYYLRLPSAPACPHSITALVAGALLGKAIGIETVAERVETPGGAKKTALATHLCVFFP